MLFPQLKPLSYLYLWLNLIHISSSFWSLPRYQIFSLLRICYFLLLIFMSSSVDGYMDGSMDRWLHWCGCFCSLNINSLRIKTSFARLTVGTGAQYKCIKLNKTLLLQSINTENTDSNYSGDKLF